VWFASNDELGLHAYSHDQKIVERDIAEQIGTLYMTYLESAVRKAGNAKELAQKLGDMVKEIRKPGPGYN
jgi:hypothetical protein